MPIIVTDRVAWSVGLSVGMSPSNTAKMAEAVETLFA